MRLILHNFLCYFNPLRGRFACFAELKIKKRKLEKENNLREIKLKEGS